MALRNLRVMGALFDRSSFVMLGGFLVMLSGFFVMLGGEGHGVLQPWLYRPLLYSFSFRSILERHGE
jgi:hypothetical protein